MAERVDPQPALAALASYPTSSTTGTTPPQHPPAPMLPSFTNFSRPLRQAAPTVIRSFSGTKSIMGVQKTVISEGSGASPQKGDTVTMEYVFRSCVVGVRSRLMCLVIGILVGCARQVSLRRRASSSTLRLGADLSRRPLVSDGSSRVLHSPLYESRLRLRS